MARLGLGDGVPTPESNILSGTWSKIFIPEGVIWRRALWKPLCFIKTFIPSHNKYMTGAVAFGFEKTQKEPDSSLQACKELWVDRMTLYSVVLRRSRTKTDSWGVSEAAFRLHTKKLMLPINYNNKLVVSSLSCAAFTDGSENQSPGEWQRRLLTVTGSLKGSQGMVGGGDCTLTS